MSEFKKVSHEKPVPTNTKSHEEKEKTSANAFQIALTNPQNHALLAKHALTIQRTLGNGFLVRLVNQTTHTMSSLSNSNSPLQRLKIPEDIDPIAPNTDDTPAFQNYLSRLFARKDFRTLLKIKKYLTNEAGNSASAQTCLNHLNTLEQQNTLPAQGGVQPLSPLQVNEITQLIPGDYARALKVLDEVKGNPDVLNRTFGVGHLAEAQENIKRIKTQLTTCYKARNIKPDEEGKLTTTGSNAHNIGEGADGVIVLSHAWSQAPQADRVGTLIHEASHGTPGLTTLDVAYLSGWCIGYLSGGSALKNADNYKKMSLLHLHEAEPDKQLQGNAQPQHIARIKRLLAIADFYVNTARINALRIQRELTPKRRVSSLNGIIHQLLWTIKCPCADVTDWKTLGKSRYSFVEDADIVRVTTFCEKFGQLVARLNAITTLQTPDAGDMLLQIPNLIIPVPTLTTMPDAGISGMIVYSLWGGVGLATWDRMDLTRLIWALADNTIGDRADILAGVKSNLIKKGDTE